MSTCLPTCWLAHRYTQEEQTHMDRLTHICLCDSIKPIHYLALKSARLSTKQINGICSTTLLLTVSPKIMPVAWDDNVAAEIALTSIFPHQGLCSISCLM